MRVAAVEDMERVRASAGAQEGAKLAPEVYARAEEERRLSLSEHAAGDDVGATLHAQRAVAAYDHALAVARLSRATTERADAQKALDDASAQSQGLDASRSKVAADAEDLEARLRDAQRSLLPALSEPASREREAARRVAARSLTVEAKLLCDATRLVAPEGDGLPDAEADLGKLEKHLETGARPTPVDDAARARARCLEVLTRARRAHGDDAGATDALLAELSAAGGWDPERDERGVVITLHDAFHGRALTSAGASKLKDLGHVASTHPAFALQLVVHDGRAPAPRDSSDAKRAEAATQALVEGGAAAARVQTELAGAHAQLVDPSDPVSASRNERLDVVFISPGR